MPNRKHISRAINAILIAALLAVLFVPGGKAWFLRQMINIGLFKPDLESSKSMSAISADQSNFKAVNADGKEVSLTDFKGRIVFINFWATWCPPCRAEMPSLQSLYERFKNDKRVEFLFVSEDDDLNKAVDFFKNQSMNMPLYRSSGQTPSDYFSGTLPTTIIIDAEGKLFYHHEGIANYNSNGFVEQLNQLAAGAKQN